MPTKLIINPASGEGKAKQIAEQVQQILSQEEVPFSTDEIYKQGGGTFLAERAVEQGFDVVVAIGGDGTANEVAHGILNKTLNKNSSSPLFGIIPAGVGNDFAKSMNLPTSLPELCRLITKKQAREVDVGSLNHRIFLNSAGIGLDAMIAKKVNEHPTKTKSQYLFAAMQSIFGFHPTKMSIQIENRPAFQMTPSLLTIMNGNVVGNYFKLAPHARLNDGVLDVCLGEKMGRFKLLRQLPKALKGELNKVKGLNLFGAESLTVKSTKRILAHVDGETFEEETFTIRVLPRVLSTIQSI